ncbi:4'-phosphopantetheinyl transferase family protein [Clavibacter tessellarius]|uniref:4'-phosphopantetheinyl transferase family protein n=1 Tax=Clavibacter tessellarius TaxID=31965 RepID=UPI0039EAF8F7
MDLRRMDAAALDTAPLTPHEEARVRGVVRVEERRRRLVGHRLLRVVLAERLGVDPDAVKIRRSACPRCGEPHGRPELQDPRAPWRFSATSSGDLVCVAVATRTIGIDLERVPSADVARSISVALTGARSGPSLAGFMSPAAAARAWTRWEALAKAVGTGICRLPCRDGRDDAHEGDLVGWRVGAIDVGGGYAAAYAIAAGPDGTAPANGGPEG